LPACAAEQFQLDACVYPALALDEAKEATPLGLTVRRAVAPEARFCQMPGFQYASWLATPVPAFQAYELENADGDVWTVQMALGPLWFDLLDEGETVASRFRVQSLRRTRSRATLPFHRTAPLWQS
jgi:hypothetical protein